MMAYLPLLDPDDDLLPLLRNASNDLLDPLVSYITSNGQGRLTSEINKLEIYQQQYPNHYLYVDEITAELQKFGGNTIANFFRGGKGILYRQVVCDVADQLRVNYNEAMDVASIETQILLKILEKAYAQMNEEERQEFLREIGLTYGEVPKTLPIQIILQLTRASGFFAYQLTVIIANAVARMVLGRGLSLALNRMVTRSLNVILGPIGWAVTALWTMVDIAGPAYRVTIPCVIQVALIRQYSQAKFCSNGHYNSNKASFCSQCGENLQ